jgi:hypothetical protein
MRGSIQKAAKRLASCGFLGLLGIMGAPAPGAAVSISGIMIYSTDDFGNPSGYRAVAEGEFEAQMWRTMNQGIWHGLGVNSGLPPESVNAPLLNFPDFSIDLPLDEGENYFTLFGEPGPLTATDDYQRFAVNLYFDGDQQSPGITVLFPRFADPNGSPVAPARPNDDQIFGLALNRSSEPAQSFYDDGLYRVSVLRASFLHAERASISVDRLTMHSLTPGGDSDWVGTLVLSVAPSESFGPGGGPPPIPGGGGGGNRGGGLGGVPQGGVPGGGYVPPAAVGGDAPIERDTGAYEEPAAANATPRQFWHKGGRAADGTGADDAGTTPTPDDLAAAFEQWIKSGEDTTATPAKSGDAATPTRTADARSTPVSTPTPDPRRTGSPQAATPTAQRTQAQTPTPAMTASQSPATTPTPHAAGALDAPLRP